MFKVTRVDHIGIAVKDLEAAKKFYEETLGIKITKEDEVIEEVKPKSVLAQKLSEMKKESEEAAKNGSKQVKRPSYSEMFGHFWNGQNFS